LCELTAQPETMAAHLSAATGRTYKVQPGRAGWQGYGTDIFYDSTKWKGLEGGVEKVMCPGTSGGERAANWAVLEHRGTGKIIVTGGIHTSYCANGCDSTHQCERAPKQQRSSEPRATARPWPRTAPSSPR